METGISEADKAGDVKWLSEFVLQFVAESLAKVDESLVDESLVDESLTRLNCFSLKNDTKHAFEYPPKIVSKYSGVHAIKMRSSLI